jgi:hypothetical protein
MVRIGEIMQYTYAEIERETNAIRYIGTAPFVPDFGQAAPIYAVDITGMEPMPAPGWTYDPEIEEFAEPETEASEEAPQ